jgi:hypothetical protein
MIILKITVADGKHDGRLSKERGYFYKEFKRSKKMEFLIALSKIMMVNIVLSGGQTR